MLKKLFQLIQNEWKIYKTAKAHNEYRDDICSLGYEAAFIKRHSIQNNTKSTFSTTPKTKLPIKK